MHPATTSEFHVLRIPSRAVDADLLAVEEPVEIRVNGAPLAVTMRTPGHDAELAAGFCLTEGIIDEPDELERAEACTLADYGNVVLITLSGKASERWRNQQTESRREFYLSSSCGLCGTQTLERIARRIELITQHFCIAPDVLLRMPHIMMESQDTFARTGGLHASALFRANGELQLIREDVGRHNAVDKVIGALLLSGQLPNSGGVLMLSGRISFELVQKAARAGIAIIAAIGAPSSLAVQAAEQFGITLIGFLRAERFNVYSHAHRIEKASPK